jgi:hypothetical protein
MDRYGGIFHPKMEERGSSVTMVPFCHTTWHMPEDSNLVFNFCLDAFNILHFIKTV